MSHRQTYLPSVAPAGGAHRLAEGGWRRIAFRLGAILLGLAPFLLLECVLTLVDVGGYGCSDDPMAGFGRLQPCFEVDEGGDFYCTVHSRQKYLGQQQFARKKPEKTFRIFGLGGSTMRGRPYETDTSFLKWLEIELNGRDARHRYESVNCGGLSYASYRLASILDEVLRYEPDLIVIATGHNEFLEDRTYDSIKNRSDLANWTLDRLYSLRTVRIARELGGNSKTETDGRYGRASGAAEVNTRLDSLIGYASYHRDDQWRREVIEQFERSVRDMVDTCRQAGVPLVLVNLGENLRDCPPFKSEHKPGLSALSLQRWQDWLDTATKLDEDSPKEALNAYRAAELTDSQYALLIYRMARCFDRLGEMEQARRYYARAKDLDVCPLRMLDEMHERLKRLADDTDTPLLDAEQLLADMSPDGLPGNDCFMDHVHPSIGIHQRIGRALAANLEQSGLVSSNRRWGDGQRRLAFRRYFQELGPAYLANGRRRVEWLDTWSCRHRLDAEMLPKDARGHLHLGQQRLDFGEYDLAWEQFQLAMQENPELSKNILEHALGLFSEGRGNLAEEILVRLHHEPAAAALRPQIELAYLVLAMDGGRTREAEEIYNQYRDPIERASRSSMGWLDAVPSALDQVRAQVDRGPLENGTRAAEKKGLATGNWELEKPEEGRPIQIKRWSIEIADQAPLGPRPSSVTREASGRFVGVGGQGDEKRPAAEVESTIRLLDGAIRRNPGSPQLYVTRARLYLSVHDLNAALVNATTAIRLSPDSPAGYKLRAGIYTMQGRFKPAVDDLTKANRIDPGDPNVLTVRGYAYQRLGEDAKADADDRAANRLLDSRRPR